MAREFPNLSDVLDHGFDDLIDVRSPAEFAEDHLPGAINLPALSNAERAQVGTIYVQDSAFKARKIGAALVARNVAAHLEGPLSEKDGGWRPLIYCWRGGQRSGSFASILTQIGWRAETVVGGYRSWRRLVTRALYDQPWPARVVLLDGNTGTAKTEVLHLLQARGLQVLDLEGLARHRGSVLGARPGGQPSQKSFETAVAGVLAGCDLKRPLVVEAESSKVGDLLVPPRVWAAMRSAPRFRIEAPLAARAAYLSQAYRDIAGDRPTLERALRGLKPIAGRAAVDRWLSLVAAGTHEALAADLMKVHYDPRYARSATATPTAVFEAADLSSDSLEALADRLAARIRVL